MIMLNNDLKHFCNRWIQKADRYSNDTTEDVFDKFFSLYVAYNAIYSDVTLELIKAKKIGKKWTKDKVSATKNIPVYIGQDRLYTALQLMRSDIDAIVELINNGTFHISTKEDNITPNTEQDKKFLFNIESNNETKGAYGQKKYNEAVLSLIYGARCNMFHGSKSFEPIQETLLIPMNNILEMIMKELLLKDRQKG